MLDQLTMANPLVLVPVIIGGAIASIVLVSALLVLLTFAVSALIAGVIAGKCVTEIAKDDATQHNPASKSDISKTQGKDNTQHNPAPTTDISNPTFTQAEPGHSFNTHTGRGARL